MGRILLMTVIEAPAARCFDLARSVDFHVVTAEGSGEHVVAGRTSGLLAPGERVTWRAKHLGVTQELEVEVTACERPEYLRDEMVRGVFTRMRHDHRFEERDGTTHMHDDFRYAAPLGPLGWLADVVLVKRHLRAFLVQRARILKAAAESDQWREFVGE